MLFNWIQTRSKKAFYFTVIQRTRDVYVQTSVRRIASIKHLATEALIGRCSVKKVFLKISQNSQENTCARVSF